MRTRRMTWGALASVLVLVLAGCVAPERPGRAAVDKQCAAAKRATTSPNCLFGVPEQQAGFHRGPTRLLLRQGYALEHSSQQKIPVWVAEHVIPQHLDGPAQRITFGPDPNLPPGERAEPVDYAKANEQGYQQGHQAPADDFKYDQDRMDETFVLSNAVPQVKSFNNPAWLVLENRVRKCVRQRGEAYVITGTLVLDANEEDDTTTAVETVGPDDVVIPTHLYKIILSKSDAGKWEALAVVMKNEKYSAHGDAGWDFTPYLKSIDWIEARTGINFMPQLDKQDPNLEKQLEAQPAADLWPCLK